SKVCLYPIKSMPLPNQKYAFTISNPLWLYVLSGA
ncbi:hypothetical protein ACUW99_002263, partial [Staphylococcus hominis]